MGCWQMKKNFEGILWLNWQLSVENDFLLITKYLRVRDCARHSEGWIQQKCIWLRGAHNPAEKWDIQLNDHSVSSPPPSASLYLYIPYMRSAIITALTSNSPPFINRHQVILYVLSHLLLKAFWRRGILFTVVLQVPRIVCGTLQRPIEFYLNQLPLYRWGSWGFACPSGKCEAGTQGVSAFCPPCYFSKEIPVLCFPNLPSLFSPNDHISCFVFQHLLSRWPCVWLPSLI